MGNLERLSKGFERTLTALTERQGRHHKKRVFSHILFPCPGYENANFQYMADKVGVKADAIYRYCCNGFRAAFIPEEQKQDYIARVDSAFAEVMGQEALQTAKAQ